MPTPTLPDSEYQRVIDAWLETGKSITQGATSLGMNYNTFKSRLKTAKSMGLHTDPSVRAGMVAMGMTRVPPGGWIKSKPDPATGLSYSYRFQTEQVEESPEELIDRIADRLNSILPAPFIDRPPAPSSTLRNFLPLADVHLSLKVGSYGTAEAVERVREGARDVIGSAASAEYIVICNMGDFTEHNDPSNQTPKSKHPLSVDMHYDDTTDVAIDLTVELIDMGLARSEHVIYKAIRANHDPNTTRILRAALRQRYRNDPRVTIDASPVEFFAHEWGSNLICAHHGDIRGKRAADYVLGMAAQYPEMWGRTKYREMWTGHLHSLLTQEVPGMTAYRARAIAPMGYYAKENLFISESEIQMVTYREKGGRRNAVNHIFERLTA